MRFDPEDFASVVHYGPKRLAGEVKTVGSQSLRRLLFVGVGLVVMVVIWASVGPRTPSDWFTTTRWAAIIVAASLVVTAVVVVIEKFAFGRPSLAFHTAMLVLLLVASSLLLVPVIMLAGIVAGYDQVMRRFAGTLGSYGQIVIKPLLGTLNGVNIGMVVAIVVVCAGLLSAFVALFIWLRTPRSLGHTHRKVLQLALWLPPGLMILCGAGLILLSKRLIPKMQTTLGSDDIVPNAAILDDWLIWLLLCGMLVTVIMFLGGATRLVTGAILLARLPQGAALRIDAAGMLLDVGQPEPQRVAWPAIDLIAGRPRQALPGPELVIGRSGQSLWTMPFLFFDVLPGTIDSAIRASTHDGRDLDLSAMDKII